MGLGRSLWHLARPALWPSVVALVLLGFGVGLWDGGRPPRGALGCALVAWTLLHAGALWLNAALDRDEGEVLLGRAVPVPEGIERFAWAALAGCVAVGAWGGPALGGVAAASAALAVLYSHPRTRWKGHPVGGPFVNGLGFGLLAPLAGWITAGAPPGARAVAIWLLVGLASLGAYYMAQVFQEQEDRSRGYRTLVATHGADTALRVARGCVGAALVGGLTMAATGVLPPTVLLTAPLALWVDRWFARWSRDPRAGGEAAAREAARRLVLTGAAGLLLVGLDVVRERLVAAPAEATAASGRFDDRSAPADGGARPAAD